MPSTSSKKCANVTGYTPDVVEKLLKAQRSHPVKGNWRRDRIIEDLEFYDCNVVWRANGEANDLSGETIPDYVVKLAVPKGMQGLIEKLQSLHGRNAHSLPTAVKDHFLVASKERLEQIGGLKITCTFSGKLLLVF